MQLRRVAVREHVPGLVPVLVCLLLVVASAVPVGFGRVPLPDRVVRGWVAAHQEREVFTVLDAVARVAHWPWICLVLIVLAATVAIARGCLRPVRQAVLGVLGGVVVVGLLKAVFARPGPTGVAPPPHDGAWPSGHAMVLVVATVVVLRLFPALRRRGFFTTAMAFLPAVVVSAALVYCGDHWLTDVAVAFPMGLLTAWGVLTAEDRFGRRGQPEPYGCRVRGTSTHR